MVAPLAHDLFVSVITLAATIFAVVIGDHDAVRTPRQVALLDDPYVGLDDFIALLFKLAEAGHITPSLSFFRALPRF
jgi:hypothetical protein